MIDYYDLVYILHFLVIGPLLIYVGYYKEKIDKKIFDIVMWFGLIVTVYHLYKFINTMIKKNKYKSI